MANYQHDPFIDANATLLKQAGTESYTSGRDTTKQGVQTVAPAADFANRLLSGDYQTELSAVQPEADTISQQFNSIRQMISDQPRGGGKTSALAELPVEQIKAISNLLGQAKLAAPGILQQVAGLLTGTGLTQSGQAEAAASSAANIGLAGRAQDIGSSWKSFFQNLVGQAVSGAAKGATGGLAAAKGGGTETLSF